MRPGNDRRFPSDFRWGFATSSYQIEGAHDADGKGESIWDRFAHEPGRIETGETGDVACDHYHRWKEDLDLMASLNANAYRFSISWPRIIPDGDGEVNRAGIDFYSRLVDGLLERNIEPFATLYHWDLPQALHDRGGWPSRSVVDAFARYTEVITDALGDRVKRWTTLNEPWVTSIVGYADGRLAPGHSDIDEALAASHHLLLAHAKAVPIIKALDAEVGISNCLFQVESMTPEGAAAATIQDGTMNRWFLDPLVGKGYPEDAIAAYERDMSFVRPGDLDEIAAPIDFLGINYYMRMVADGPDEDLDQGAAGDSSGDVHGSSLASTGDLQRTALGWEIYPKGLAILLDRVNREYKFPALYITENGACYRDTVGDDDTIHDAERIDYLRAHFGVAHDAVAAGIPLRGFFVWTFLDNFEWNHGTSARFGVVYVDFPTQRRIVKDSGRFCASVFRGANDAFSVPAHLRPDAG